MRKRASFLTADEPKALLNVMRKRKVEALQVRRANALVALDDGHSVQMVSRIFYLDPDTVRGWLRDFREKGLASVELADYPDRAGRLTADQEAAKAHSQRIPRHPEKTLIHGAFGLWASCAYL